MSGRDNMKNEALFALVHTQEKQSIAKMLVSWMRIRHGVEEDEQKVAVLLEYVILEASDFSPLLTNVVTGLVAMLNGAEHRVCDLEQENGALLIERDNLLIERDNLRALMGLGGPAVKPEDVASAMSKEREDISSGRGQRSR